MEPITGLDATFLYTETANSPMHVGSVAVIEGSLNFEDFRQVLLSRLHLIPKLRQKLVQVPFNIDYPYWADDPNFDIDMHLQHIALPQPGSWKELRNTASSIMSEHLDRSRPLWSITFVEGLNNIPQVPAGSVALIAKIHHVAIDGMAGAGLLSLIFDFSPKPAKLPAPKPYEPKPFPDQFSLIYNSTMSFLSKPLRLPQVLSDAVSTTFKLGFMNQAQNIKLPIAPFTAPPSVLNRIISPRRKWNTAILSLDRVKALKDAMDTTLNDVILAICSGALRRYLLEKKKLPLKPLVGMVPISTRTPAENRDLGNQISSMLVQLPTHIEDPIERLETVHENTIRGKIYQQALGAKTLAKLAEAVPFGIANQAAQLYSQYQIAEMHNPVFNVTITNVPGPQMPLYINGHKLLSVMGMAPIIDGMGLIITIFSYNGLITVSPTSDANTMPDIDVFTRYLRESANELEAAIQKHLAEKELKNPEEPQESQIDKLFEMLKNLLKNNAEQIPANSGVFQLEIQNKNTHYWKIDLRKSPGILKKEEATKPDVSLKIKEEHLSRLLQGEFGWETAYVQGRLNLEGDKNKLKNLDAMFAKTLATNA
ncbi:MAG: wax ester/triacylglycerol synthase family O-acyltransferase [Microscillaceae bacterium]|jgi:WS/DGAT/MGAT family acyltransferase|nr:wax ester/triacylglycerol synthase family O-acyltransferase [Microscillaceae bacterium]